MPNFFRTNQTELQFEWNSAHSKDWYPIQRIFVSAFLSVYKNLTVEELQYGKAMWIAATAKWNIAYERALVEGIKVLLHEIIHPLKFYLFYEPHPLEHEIQELHRHFLDRTHNIDAIKYYLIKLMMLKNAKEEDFQEEYEILTNGIEGKDYLIVRYREQPVAFFVCKTNYKTARVHVYWATVSPSFHRQGLGEIVLDQIATRYPSTIGIELSAFTPNIGSCLFYRRCGFQETRNFNFDRPILTMQNPPIAFPTETATDIPDALLAFYRRHPIKFI